VHFVLSKLLLTHQPSAMKLRLQLKKIKHDDDNYDDDDNDYNSDNYDDDDDDGNGHDDVNYQCHKEKIGNDVRFLAGNPESDAQIAITT